VRQRRLVDIIAPDARTILFCIAISIFIFYGLTFFPQSGESVVGNISNTVKSPLSALIDGFIASTGLAGKIVLWVLYLLLSFMILRVNDNFSFIRVRTILPSLFFLITGGVLLRNDIFSSGIIVAFLIFSAFYFSLKLLMEEQPKYAFNVSLIIFTAALFSLSCVWLLVLFWIFAYSSNVLTFRVFLASLLGALTAVLYAVIGFYLAGGEYQLLVYIQDSFKFFAVNFHFSPFGIAYLVLTGLLILASLVDYMRVSSQENIKTRKEFSYIIMLFILVSILIILSVPDSDILLWLAVIFGSFLMGRFFSFNNNLFTKIFLSLYFVNSLLLFLFK